MTVADLRCGRWQDVLSDVTGVDCLIVDAPYSERTHAGHDSATNDSSKLAAGEPRNNLKRQALCLDAVRRGIDYAAWTPSNVGEFVASWSPRTRGWFVSITDHVLSAAWIAELQAAGRYVFAPLPFVETGSRVRLAGDGPSGWTCWTIVARPRSKEFARWGTLPGAYIDSCERGRGVVGGKPLSLMRSLVRDYSRPGETVVDPCAGGATTLLAALMEGRRAVGAEMDQNHYEIGRKRLAKGFTPPLRFATEERAAIQESLFGGDK